MHIHPSFLPKTIIKSTTLLFYISIFFLACEPSTENSKTPVTSQPDTLPSGQTTAIDTTLPSPSLVDEDTLHQTNQKAAVTPPAYRFPYLLNKPDDTYKLSKKLIEISGLSLSPDGQQLIAVNDEQGKIFYLNKTNGNIEREVKFGGNGDYEGIEAVGEKIYVVQSNGDVFEVKDPDKDKPDTREHETKLNTKYDVEGLGYDAANNRLLLACKGKAGDDKSLKGKRAVYAFDLAEKKLGKEPVYVIDRSEIKARFKSGDVSQKLLDIFTSDYASDAFGPSGIAIDPKTSDICIISSVGKLLVILSPTGIIKYMEHLDASIFKQPEGICFDKDGTLYISTEGKGGRGKIFRFSQQ